MLQKKGHKTLRDDVEALRAEKRKPKTGKIFYFFIFLLLLLVGASFPGYIIYIEGFICLLSLFQYGLTLNRTKKDKRKLQKRYEKKVRILPWAILTIYFAFFAVILTVYGVLYYVLRLSVGFSVREWMKYSLPVFLLFEIVVLQLNVRMEREV